jgi:hypothetical protein
LNADKELNFKYGETPKIHPFSGGGGIFAILDIQMELKGIEIFH